MATMSVDPYKTYKTNQSLPDYRSLMTSLKQLTIHKNTQLKGAHIEKKMIRGVTPEIGGTTLFAVKPRLGLGLP